MTFQWITRLISNSQTTPTTRAFESILGIASNQRAAVNDYPQLKSWFLSGTDRIRLPVTWNTALTIAGGTWAGSLALFALGHWMVTRCRRRWHRRKVAAEPVAGWCDAERRWIEVREGRSR